MRRLGQLAPLFAEMVNRGIACDGKQPAAKGTAAAAADAGAVATPIDARVEQSVVEIKEARFNKKDVPKGVKVSGKITQGRRWSDDPLAACAR